MKQETFRKRHRERRVEAGGLGWGVIQTKGRKGGPTLILVPGTLGTADIFWNQMAALGQHVRIVSLTVPNARTITGLADALAKLMDKLGIAKASLLGSSLGGYLVQHFAARHPERIETLFVANTLIDPTRLRGPSVAEARRMPAKQHLEINQARVRTMPTPDAGFKLMQKALLDAGLRLGAATLKMRVLIVRGGPPVPKLSLPQSRIVTIDSKDDQILPQAELAAVRRRYPKARHVRLPMGGHFPYITRPEIYIELFRRHLIG
ncbi:MAG: alpha/beta hydrolase [Proteobacteria bacterium]|nr:alpha/beta hydrolase [Pseudomonadota bacterium]MBI3496723.1 alpha/beta hydrolase [Pseudomonadota bacterium]